MRYLAMAICALAAGCSARGDEPGYIVSPGMHFSVPYDAYDPNPITGATLRLPPEGTMPQGTTPFLYAPGPDEAARAGRELQQRLPPDRAQLARGKQVFETFCAVCHGLGGQGDGPIIGRYPNPPSLLAARAMGLPDGHVFHLISHGQGLMPSYGAQVRPDDRWRVVLYLRQLQGASQGKAP